MRPSSLLTCPLRAVLSGVPQGATSLHDPGTWAQGLKVGAAQICPKLAGFIVNTGGATARDVLELMKTVQAKVKDAFDVELEPEVVVIGEDARE